MTSTATPAMDYAMRSIFAAYPDLDLQGWGASQAPTLTSDEAWAFQVCVDFLSQQTPRKTISKRSPGSYGLKHVVERWQGARGPYTYVANGILIAAAIYQGIRIKLDPPCNCRLALKRAW